MIQAGSSLYAPIWLQLKNCAETTPTISWNRKDSRQASHRSASCHNQQRRSVPSMYLFEEMIPDSDVINWATPCPSSSRTKAQRSYEMPALNKALKELETPWLRACLVKRRKQILLIKVWRTIICMHRRDTHELLSLQYQINWWKQRHGMGRRLCRAKTDLVAT